MVAARVSRSDSGRRQGCEVLVPLPVSLWPLGRGRDARAATLGCLIWCLCAALPARAQTLSYHISVPTPEQGWMRVGLTLDDLGPAPLDINLSEFSPGRYAQHPFWRYLTAMEARDPSGAALILQHPSRSRWLIRAHGRTVHLEYLVRHANLDGTYVAVDATHAHINMPAALVWIRGFEDRPATVRLTLPAGRQWGVATQLFPTSESFTFSSPNLQYLMDSPVELSPFGVRTFRTTEGGATTITLALHHEGSERELDALARDLQQIVHTAMRVFGEWPDFDPRGYTFLADYVPGATVDGMEHRNSAVLTMPPGSNTARVDLLDGFAHEFFHAWNAERIRPRSLEPFAFDRPSPSSELWLVEGFTQYYGTLIVARAGLLDVASYAEKVGSLVTEVEGSRARRGRSLEAMSRLAVQVDGEDAGRAAAAGPFLSYYSWGAVVGLSLDLELRARTRGRASLDDVMRWLWAHHGRDPGPAVGLVARPYVTADVEKAIAEVSGDPRFARLFLTRYVRGSAVPDMGRLLQDVGLVWRNVGGRRVMRPIELDGGELSLAQRDARQAWLGASGDIERDMAPQENSTPRASLKVGSRARLTARISSSPASP